MRRERLPQIFLHAIARNVQSQPDGQKPTFLTEIDDNRTAFHFVDKFSPGGRRAAQAASTSATELSSNPKKALVILPWHMLACATEFKARNHREKRMPSMDQEPQNAATDVAPLQEDATETESISVDATALDTASLPFVGLWNELVSNTNWEKGRIISQWRDALIESDAPATEYSDEAWSRRVGGVTGQHVGRLRRVYQRFGQTHGDFAGLYWSHFQAALDWDDAEMWLEGAIQNSWSVAQMRHQRWDAMGALEEDRPQDDEIVTGELDEDFEPATNEPPGVGEMSTTDDVQLGAREEGPDFGDGGSDASDGAQSEPGAAVYADDLDESTVEFVRPFADLKDLPEDLAEAFEAYKLAILHHKMKQWEAISREDVLASLESLKQLVVAPSSEQDEG